MPDIICQDLPDFNLNTFNNDNGLPRLKQFLQQHCQCWQGLLLDDLRWLHDQAFAVHDLRILELSQIEANRFKLRYEFTWQQAAGCADIVQQDLHCGNLILSVNNQAQIIFHLVDMNAFSGERLFD